MKTTIKPGFYLISGVERDSYLGTGAEPRSEAPKPKPIVRLPGGVRAPIWEVVKKDKGYLIKVSLGKGQRLPVSPMDGRLYAFSEEPPRPEIWDIDNSKKDGSDIFTVTCMNGTEGWVLDDADYSQVCVRDLIVGPSDPPSYPANELFRFAPYTMPLDE